MQDCELKLARSISQTPEPKNCKYQEDQDELNTDPEQLNLGTENSLHNLSMDINSEVIQQLYEEVNEVQHILRNNVYSA